MAVFNNILAGASGQAGGAAAENRSLRFNSADSAFLSRTPASAGNRKTWTWAGWVKRAVNSSSNQSLFCVPGSSSDSTTMNLVLESNGALSFAAFTFAIRATTQVFRDFSAWYHIVLAFDTTQATGSDRVKIYVNGVQVTSFSSSTDPSLNTDYGVNNNSEHTIGRNVLGGAGQNYQLLNGYLADVHFVDGQALGPTSFGEFDATTGVWNPIAYTGTHGTNGFYLDFADNSSAAALGYDAAGNNDWTVNNISVTAGVGNDSLFDHPTNGDTANDTGAGGEVPGNYCTWNPLQQKGTITLSNGNLDVNSASTAHGHCGATFAVSSGKWYWELTKSSSTAAGADGFGFAKTKLVPNPSFDYLNLDAGKNYIFTQSNLIYMVDNGTTTSVSSASAANDAGVYMFAYDFDNGKGWVGKDGVWWTWNALTGGDPANGTNPVFDDFTAGDFYTPVMQHYTASNPYSANFGQRPFSYSAPSGFRPLATPFLPTPTIEDGSAYMDVALYTGNGSTQTISGLGFSPDWVWLKIRNTAGDHGLWDAIRGTSARLNSGSSAAEDTTVGVTAFNSDGFTVGGPYNSSSNTWVAWTWDAGSSTVSNTDGSITSQVRAQPSAGFSIVTYTSNVSSNQTVGHGLNAAPHLVIVKNRDDGGDPWAVYTKVTGKDKYLYLNTSARAESLSEYWGSAEPTSTVFGVGTGLSNNRGTDDMVAYCFAPVEGYSAFGSYTGNGSTDGPFVYTGFDVKFILLKQSSASGERWYIQDIARDINANDAALWPNSSDAEFSSTSYAIDFLSNGFKLRNTNGSHNSSGSTYVYACFAENPFSIARAR